MKPKDVLAGLVLVVYTIMKLRGLDGSMDAALGLMLGYYFVKRSNGQDNGK